MSVKDKLCVLIEGTIGDSLILVPTLRLIDRHFSNHYIEIVSFTDTPAISSESVLGATFPRFKFHVINNAPQLSRFERLKAWLTLCKRIRSENFKSVLYAFRPESSLAADRARLHKRLLATLTNAELCGFEVTRWPHKQVAQDSKQNSIARILFEHVCRSLNAEAKTNQRDSQSISFDGSSFEDLNFEDLNFEDLSFKIELTQKDKSHAEEWLNKHLVSAGGDSQKRYYALCVSAKTATQRWPLERYLAIVKHLYRSSGIEPVFIGAPSDAQSHTALITKLGFGYSIAGMSLGQSAAIIRSADFYLGNDTGPMHLATAVGLTCVVLMSSKSLVGTWKPLGDGHIVHQSITDCIGCALSECKFTNQHCLTNIAVNEVLASCKKVLMRKSLH